MLKVTQQGALAREEISNTEEGDSTPQTHTVKTIAGTSQNESWPEIAGQYGLSPRELLKLNPSYDADLMALKAGDVLLDDTVGTEHILDA